jgi:nucleotide-binding universal stress UspA family protein
LKGENAKNCNKIGWKIRDQKSLTAASAERRDRMFKQILCPTDLKDRSDMAVKKAVQIAHQFGSKITLLNVHEEFMDNEEREMLRVSVNKMKEKYRHIALDAREEMKAVIHQLHADDIEVDYLLHSGKPGNVIVEVAKQLGPDLIVMCTDGRDSIMDFVVGTITEHVINASPCPVLVIPNRK